MTESTDAPTASAAELFERMQRQWLEGGLTGDLLAEDVVVEAPFTATGRPRRTEGRANFLAFAQAAMAARPVRIEECRNVMIHHTIDPEVIVVEYELVASVPETGRRGTASFIGVLTARNGQIVRWREYQNMLAMAEAMAQPPTALADLGDASSDAAQQR